MTITNDDEHETTLNRLELLLAANHADNSKEAQEIETLIAALIAYEDIHYPLTQQ